jgi:hypothetical protein
MKIKAALIAKIATRIAKQFIDRSIPREVVRAMILQFKLL